MRFSMRGALAATALGTLAIAAALGSAPAFADSVPLPDACHSRLMIACIGPVDSGSHAHPKYLRHQPDDDRPYPDAPWWQRHRPTRLQYLGHSAMQGPF